MLIEHVAAQLTHGQDRPHAAFQQNVNALVELYGSGRAAARELRVAESTFRGWRKGVVPRDAARIENVARVTRGARIDAFLLERARSGDPDFLFTVRGVIKTSDDERERTIYPGRYIPVRVVNQAIMEWAMGNDNAADRTLLNAIDEYYQPFAYTRVDFAGFGNPPR